MQTTVYQPDLQTLGQQLQLLFAEMPLGIRCMFKDDSLIVLGQHQSDLSLEPKQVLQSLERKIQSLQIGFTHRVQLYLQRAGQQEPYAQRQFLIQPPPPPPNPKLCQGSAKSAEVEEAWIPADEELSDLMHQLVAVSPTPEQSTALAAAGSESSEMGTFTPASLALLQSAIERVEPALLPGVWRDRQAMAMLGVAMLGFTAGVYGITRPCVLGSCTEIQTARSLSQQLTQTLQQANTPQDLQSAQQQIGKAVAMLETIPLWSVRHSEAQTLLKNCRQQGEQLAQVTGVEDLAEIALQKSQNAPLSVSDWRSVQTLWQSTIRQLEKTPVSSDLAPFVQRKLDLYRAKLADAEQQMQQEQQAEQILNTAKEAVKLAKAREGVAQTPANWQLVRGSWQAVIDRLQQVPSGTASAKESFPLLEAYRAKLNQIDQRIQKERSSAQILEEANQQALKAQEAEQNSNWQQAVENWNQAISSVRKVPVGSAYQASVDSLVTAYTNGLNQAEQKVQSTQQIQTEVDKLCVGQLRICNLLSVGTVVKVQLASTYVEAINTARDTGDTNLQAIVADHQLALRSALEKLASQLHLPVEVYDPGNALLDRHMP
ncbi:MAG: hypothetical protein KME16_11685 [Scytolyngbya sp. HA4215-MV1]|jgi:hypothetical protein|nr:hypothetical protein [Scytolyngbya sp. HA4215-MV1]